MKKINFKQTFINGLFLALPLLAILYLGIKIIRIIEKVISPIANQMGIQRLLGELTLTIFAILILLILFFILGVFLHLKLLSDLNKQVESLAYKLIPQLYKLKTFAISENEYTSETAWKTVILQEGDDWVPAYITEENEKLITFFIPDAPDGKSGAVKMMDAEKAKFHPVDGRKFHAFMRSFGKGMIDAK